MSMEAPLLLSNPFLQWMIIVINYETMRNVSSKRKGVDLSFGFEIRGRFATPVSPINSFTDPNFVAAPRSIDQNRSLAGFASICSEEGRGPIKIPPK